MKWREFSLLHVGLIPFHEVTFNLMDSAIRVLKIMNYLIVPALDDIHPITQGRRSRRTQGQVPLLTLLLSFACDVVHECI